MNILVFDNYDSFTYNLVHLVEKILHQKVDVYRNDQIPVEKVKEYDKIILSPGPGIPEDWTVVTIDKTVCFFKILYWEFVWDTRQSAKHLEGNWRI